MDELQRLRLSELTESQVAHQWQLKAQKMHMLKAMEELRNRSAEIKEVADPQQAAKIEELEQRIAELEKSMAKEIERKEEYQKENVSLKLQDSVLKTQIKDHVRNIESLKAEIHGLKVDMGNPRKRVDKDYGDEILRQKYAQLEAEHLDLQAKYEDLEEKFHRLLEKLRRKGCDEEVESACKELGI